VDTSEEELIRQLSGQKRRTRRLLIGFLSVLLIGPFVPFGWAYFRRWQEERASRLDDNEAAELKRLLDAGRGERLSCQNAWRAACNQIQQLEPGPDPCNTPLMAPADFSAKSYVESGSIDGNYFGSWSLRLIRDGEPLGDSSGCAGQEWAADELRKRLERGEADKDDLAQARRSSGHREHGYQVLLRVHDERKPTSLGETFIPGHVAGRAYLYSDGERRFLCAGDVAAANSPDVKINYTYMQGNFLDQEMKSRMAANGALERDLQVQLRKAVADGLQVVARRAENTP
jgi:hypothetical protein